MSELSRRHRYALHGAFVLSGAAGLTYELVWGRYFGLLLGHGAYAQVLVIAVYLGGMAFGSVFMGQWAERVERPLVAYAGVEVLLAVAGLAFHPLFLVASDSFYEVVVPGIGGTPTATVVKWGLTGLLVLPQAMLLGATFPLMTAGLLRRLPARAGRSVADVYLWNTLGGAVGILVAGFLLMPAVGTVGTLVAAAAGNLLAAAVAFGCSRIGGGLPRGVPTTPDVPGGPVPVGGSTLGLGSAGPLWRFLLAVAFLTAFASFQYEVAWIRMLSLVMGSATHSFELMLSAFLLGLALGSWLVRRSVDRTARPLALLGGVQWIMGATALATLPAYLLSFDVAAWLVSELPSDGRGFALYNLARYGLALSIMLPSTLMAGMTVPLIAGTLLRAGAGERAVGWVYGLNTLGSVVGVATAGLVLLPLLGLKGLLTAGAGVDMALGVVILLFAGSRSWVGPAKRTFGWYAAGAAVLAVLLMAGTAWHVPFDRVRLTSGVFRYGSVPDPGDREVRFYGDGRTASVGVHVTEDSLVVLSTNGKPDASLPTSWLEQESSDRSLAFELPPPVTAADVSPQTIGPLVLLAHAPRARTGIIVGHGSGMSAHALLSSTTLERLFTVEIEPLMVEASRQFLPANERPYVDSRHEFVYDDARSFLAARQTPWDLVFSEPSNPWVSGVSGLFTVEYYRLVRERLAENGVYGQWLQLYEIDDELVLSVLRAIDDAFDDYRAYQVGALDLLVVAAGGAELPEPDWGLLDEPGLREATRHMPPLRPRHLELLRMFDREDISPLLARSPEPVNSDFDPVLDMGSERIRFLGTWAEGIGALGSGQRFDLIRTLRRERRLRRPFLPVPVWTLDPLRAEALSAWVGMVGPQAEDVIPPYASWVGPYETYASFVDLLGGEDPPADWTAWTWDFVVVEETLHGGTAGWSDEAFYRESRAYLERHSAPEPPRAVVAFLHGLAAWDFEEAAEAAGVLMELEPEERALYPELLLDGAVVAFLETGRTDDAVTALRLLSPLTGLSPVNARTRLLEALVAEAEGAP